MLAILALVLTGLLALSCLAQDPPDPELRELLRQTVSDTSGFIDRFEAEVWLVDMAGRLSHCVKPAELRLDLLRALHSEAGRAGLSPEQVLSVIHVESLFDPYALSRAGAQGLMQVMPFWKDEIGRPQVNLCRSTSICAMAAPS